MVARKAMTIVKLSAKLNVITWHHAFKEANRVDDLANSKQEMIVYEQVLKFIRKAFVVDLSFEDICCNS